METAGTVERHPDGKTKGEGEGERGERLQKRIFAKVSAKCWPVDRERVVRSAPHHRVTATGGNAAMTHLLFIVPLCPRFLLFLPILPLFPPNKSIVSQLNIITI